MPRRRSQRQPRQPSFDALPDELLLKIIKFACVPAGFKPGEKYNHDFLANVLGQVSVRFKKIASDDSLWKGVVWIGRHQGNQIRHGDLSGPRTKPETIEWIIGECLNAKTTLFHMPGNVVYHWYERDKPSGRPSSCLEFIFDPRTRFPKLQVKLWAGIKPAENFLAGLRRDFYLTPAQMYRKKIPYRKIPIWRPKDKLHDRGDLRHDIFFTFAKKKSDI